MRYAQIRSLDTSNGEGIGIALFVQGCHFMCKNCFNKDTWDFNGGYEYTEDTLYKLINIANKKHIKRLSMLGGECLCEENYNDSLELVKTFKNVYPEKKIWLWTGYMFEEIQDKEILNYIDYLIDGRYVDELQDFHLKWKGSSNQRVIDMKETLRTNTIVIKE